MDTDTQVEGVLARSLGNVFVGTDTGGFESFTGQLLIFIGNKVSAEGELVYRGLLTAKVENTNLMQKIIRKT